MPGVTPGVIPGPIPIPGIMPSPDAIAGEVGLEVMGIFRRASAAYTLADSFPGSGSFN